MSTRLAIKEANKSCFKERLGAVISKGKRILGRGFNEINRHQKHWTASWEGSLHAEEAALLQAVKKHGVAQLHGATIHVVRLSKSDQLALAKPCKHCETLLRNFGIKEVYYSTSDGMEQLVL